MRRPGFGLRAKLVLVALCLAPLPWAGYRYVREMERVLLEGQAQSLVATARAVATALHDRPALMRLPPREDAALRLQAEEELRELVRLRGAAPIEAPAPGVESQLSMPPAEPASNQAPSPGEQPPVGLPLPQPASADAPSAEKSVDSREIAAILQGLERNAARIWVINRDYRVLSLTGSLEPAAPRTDARETGIDGLLRRLSRPLIAWLIQDPPGTADPPRTGGSQILEVQDALRGLPRSGLRFSADGQNMILAAAHPIWSGAEVLGAVVVEETTQPIHSLRTRALEGLLLLTLAVLLVGAAVLFGFASRLSWRIRALRDEAESAVDAQGRITRIVTGSRARDEIGDLSRSLTSALAKLGQYHAYLESMAGRLSHELRTPIAVVRSSLENLKLQPLAEDSRVYVARAEDGVRRLATILTRMSEANRLEHSLRTAERERYDLAAVVSGCIDGYRLAYRNRRFSWEAPPQPVTVLGSPDLAAQMLDKLVSNANDFAAPETPIVVSLAVEEERALLAVANQGPTLNDDVLGRLFNSLVSFRATGSADEPHLGLGLYIVRLIAEHHGGSAGIANRSDPPGVTAWVRIPLA